MEYGLARHPPETEAEFKSLESGSPTAILKWVGEPDKGRSCNRLLISFVTKFSFLCYQVETEPEIGAGLDEHLSHLIGKLFAAKFCADNDFLKFV